MLYKSVYLNDHRVELLVARGEPATLKITFVSEGGRMLNHDLKKDLLNIIIERLDSKGIKANWDGTQQTAPITHNTSFTLTGQYHVTNAACGGDAMLYPAHGVVDEVAKLLVTEDLSEAITATLEKERRANRWKKDLLPEIHSFYPGHASAVADALSQALAAHPTRPSIEGDEINDKGTPKDELFKMVEQAFNKVPLSATPDPKETAKRTIAIDAIFNYAHEQYIPEEERPRRRGGRK